ncbi:RNA-binding (RRM/RBD/RNP motifs) family protein [Raphanus sativus]|uniref:Heterogeneous nuclear ribonucleoprotein 1 n=1 Tax=Raphanus sativus TaxID=3726 RepID=A0A6J0K240_RAPSA|nr:heterogeneous nuclear ribonucleoprotein 1 [Raphanus sativus]KAJ4891551.1 RNA-binding (RRM/RBD/RNP motifs) family protein [Raphanus sativus]
MESDQGKLFIGGISWETDENLLREYFSNFGEVSQVTVMRDKATGRPRGFGFVAFSDPAVIDRVLQDKHHIDNRDVDVKRAMSRDEQSPAGRQGSFNGNRSFDSGGGGANVRTKKIFVGGLPPALTSDEFRAYFETYGPVSDAVIMIDQATQRPRGFGFVSFDSEDSVDLVLHKTFHDLSGKQVEVKRALPKDANPGIASGGGGGRGSSGGFPGYGGSGYEGRVDSSRYMQPQNAGSGYPPYGAASGYGTGYGYGSNGVGYGGFGGYGNPSGAPYGNPGGPGAGFGSGPRPSWEGQAPSGYGNNVGYGNAAAAPAPWGGSGSGSAVMGQGGAASAGYGSQGYGYGGNDSSYGAQPGYGAVGGRPNSHGGGYADVPDGYGNHQGNGQAGYGGGYGRQAQQQ